MECFEGCFVFYDVIKKTAQEIENAAQLGFKGDRHRTWEPDSLSEFFKALALERRDSVSQSWKAQNIDQRITQNNFPNHTRKFSLS
jgi:hypothetical protein